MNSQRDAGGGHIAARGTPESRFIGFLRALEEHEDRGALAALRQGLGRTVPEPAALRVLVPHLPPERWKHRWYFLVGSLFALHPERGGRGNLGEVFRRIANADTTKGPAESVEKRFVALLASDADDLPHRLRQAVSLARSKDVPIDWFRLLTDLFHWEDPDRKMKIQLAWSSSFWAPADREPAETPRADAAEEVRS